MKLLDLQLIQGFYIDRRKNLPASSYEITYETDDFIIFKPKKVNSESPFKPKNPMDRLQNESTNHTDLKEEIKSDAPKSNLLNIEEEVKVM